MHLTCCLVLALVTLKLFLCLMKQMFRLTLLDGKPLSDVTHYRQLVNNLVYLTWYCSYRTGHLVSQFLVAPYSTHFTAMLHIFHYIKGTMFHDLYFSTHSTLDLSVYSKADWTRDPTDYHSTTGFWMIIWKQNQTKEAKMKNFKCKGPRWKNLKL